MAIHFWMVRVNIPTEWKGGGTYMKSHTFGVSSPTIEAAIELVRREYPDCQVWAVNHHGEIKFASDQK